MRDDDCTMTGLGAKRTILPGPGKVRRTNWIFDAAVTLHRRKYWIGKSFTNDHYTFSTAKLHQHFDVRGWKEIFSTGRAEVFQSCHSEMRQNFQRFTKSKSWYCCFKAMLMKLFLHVVRRRMFNSVLCFLVNKKCDLIKETMRATFHLRMGLFL